MSVWRVRREEKAYIGRGKVQHSEAPGLMEVCEEGGESVYRVGQGTTL